jgi:hypothetical protein
VGRGRNGVPFGWARRRGFRHRECNNSDIAQAQAYDAAGNAENIEFRVNTTIANNQSQPSVAAFSNGPFLVTWTSRNQDGSLEGVYGQRFKFDDP